MAKSDFVVVEIKRLLTLVGFKKLGKKYVKDLAEASVEIDIQNHSMGKSQHFLNLTIAFHPDVAFRENLSDKFATYARVESLDPAEKILNLIALDAESDMPLTDRNERLSKILHVDLLRFLNEWNTFESAQKAYREAEHKHAPINFELVKRWMDN
jgi:hypothetical protein